MYAEQLVRWNNLAQTILYRDELLPGDRVQFDMSTRITLSEPTFRFWYQIVKPTLNPDAVRYVDYLLAQPGRRPAPGWGNKNTASEVYTYNV